MAKEGILQFGLPLSAKAGLSVHRMWEGTPDRDHDIYVPHRDTQYLLLLVTGGGFLMGLDFDQVTINGPSVVLICPWQLHHLIQSREPVGLTIDFDGSLVEEGLLSAVSAHSGVLSLPQPVFEKALSMGTLMLDMSEVSFHASRRALLHALLSLLADVGATAERLPKSRSSLIEQAFRRLLADRYKEWKKPSEYAAALAISVSHLNDSVQSVTGISVSTHIQRHVIGEAQRLLRFSRQSVKEIAYGLGYEHPVYFSRLFKKVTGKTPLEFRDL